MNGCFLSYQQEREAETYSIWSMQTICNVDDLAVRYSHDSCVIKPDKQLIASIWHRLGLKISHESRDHIFCVDKKSLARTRTS